jgi:hypothetical protein
VQLLEGPEAGQPFGDRFVRGLVVQLADPMRQLFDLQALLCGELCGIEQLLVVPAFGFERFDLGQHCCHAVALCFQPRDRTFELRAVALHPHQACRLFRQAMHLFCAQLALGVEAFALRREFLSHRAERGRDVTAVRRVERPPAERTRCFVALQEVEFLLRLADLGRAPSDGVPRRRFARAVILELLCVGDELDVDGGRVGQGGEHLREVLLRRVERLLLLC